MKIRFALVLVFFSAIPLFSQSRPVLYTAEFRDSQAAVSRGMELLDAGDLERARERFTRAVELLDVNFHAYAYLAILDLMEKDALSSHENFQESMGRFDRFQRLVIEQKSNCANVIENMVVSMQSEQQSPHDAASDPVPPDLMDQQTALLNRAAALRAEVEADRAMVYPALYRFKYGELLFGMSQFEQAKFQYQLAVEANPDTKDAWVGLSVCWFILGNCPEAKAAFIRASELGAVVNPSFQRDLLARCGQ